MEKIFLGDSESWLKNKPITRNSQHRFIKGKSCLINLIFYDKVTHLLDKEKAADVVFLEFSKVFTVVPHSIPLDKFFSCEINSFRATLGDELAQK